MAPAAELSNNAQHSSTLMEPFSIMCTRCLPRCCKPSGHTLLHWSRSHNFTTKSWRSCGQERADANTNMRTKTEGKDARAPSPPATSYGTSSCSQASFQGPAYLPPLEARASVQLKHETFGPMHGSPLSPIHPCKNINGRGKYVGSQIQMHFKLYMLDSCCA